MYTPTGYEQYFRDVQPAVQTGAELTVDLLQDLRGRYTDASDAPCRSSIPDRSSAEDRPASFELPECSHDRTVARARR